MKKTPSIPTTKNPNDPNQFYMRLMYHEFFFGPFATEDDLVAAIQELDGWDKMWDYDGFCIIRGANPLPKSFVTGFPFVEDESLWDKIRQRRR